MANKNLHKAKRAKNDEFYTRLSDIENELRHYKNHFKDKVVYCNCDDPRTSNFFHYFSYNFETLGLKKLIATCYKTNGGIVLEYNGDKNGNRVPDEEEITAIPMEGDGDFRSPESVKLLQEADIVVSNPPFSLFREYVAQLIDYNKQFLIIGNMNAITYKEIFPLIKDNKMWLGYNTKNMIFDLPNGDTKAVFARWFTNLKHSKHNEMLILVDKYTPEKYPFYDNYNAINVNKVNDIPADYDGIMGVPITFLGKWNPDQFEIIGFTHRNDLYQLKTKVYTDKDSDNFNDMNGSPIININNQTKFVYMRILIRNKTITCKNDE